ncbi:MAG TPA: RraA family protein [Bryobacteraceae bacterium]|jgi:regulator of RNase E activity RraA
MNRYRIDLLIVLLLANKMMAQEHVDPHVKLYIPYEQYSQQDNERIIKLYQDLRVSDVSDGMDVIGLANVGIVSSDIKPLWRDTENFTHRIVGIAVTARYLPTNKREDKMPKETINRWYENLTPETFVDQLFPGCVLVIDGNEDGDTRTIGSNNILNWHKKGMVGVVTSGGLADSDEIIAEKVPAYYRRMARGFRPGRNELESVNRPVNLGGVMVRPGDVVMGDGDGVIVVPREHATDVAEAAKQFLDMIGLERATKRHREKSATTPK